MEIPTKSGKKCDSSIYVGNEKFLGSKSSKGGQSVKVRIDSKIGEGSCVGGGVEGGIGERIGEGFGGRLDEEVGGRVDGGIGEGIAGRVVTGLMIEMKVRGLSEWMRTIGKGRGAATK